MSRLSFKLCFSSGNSDAGACLRFSFLPAYKSNKHPAPKHHALSQKVKGRGGFYLKESCDWRILFRGHEAQMESGPRLVSKPWMEKFSLSREMLT